MKTYCIPAPTRSRSKSVAAANGGFTLVELIVVIGLLVLLASILVPALARTRPNSHLTQCRNNLRQIGSAVAMYGQDYQDYLPGPCWAGAMCVYCWYPLGSQTQPLGPNRYYGSLAAYIATYLELPAPSSLIQTAQVMICPANLRALPPGASYNPPESCPVPYYNHQYLRQNPNDDSSSRILCYPFGRPSMGDTTSPCNPMLADGSMRTLRITEIPNPANYWAITDDDRELNSGGTYAAWVPTYAVHGRSGDKPLRNFLFFDWHVEAQKRVLTGNP